MIGIKYFYEHLIKSHDNKEGVLGTFIGKNTIDDSVEEVRQFVHTLPDNEERIVSMLMVGYSINYISRALTISPYSISRIRNSIKVKYLPIIDDFRKTPTVFKISVHEV